MSRKRLFNDGWEFVKTPFGTDMEALKEWEGKFSHVDIPHDWLIYDTLNLYETGTGWYRKRFFVDGGDGQRRFLRFDGVYMDTHVYVNGRQAGEWKYGYSTFEFEITKLLQPGENEVAVRVDHHNPNSRWYSSAGIYRNVWMLAAPETYLVSDGIYVVSRRDGDGFCVEISAEVGGASEKDAEGLGASVKIEYDGKIVAEGVLHKGTSYPEKNETGVTLSDAAEFALTGTLRVENPLLWDAENPNLYRLTVTLSNGDSDTVTIGFREFAYEPDTGFWANGKNVKLNGVCEHHDLGALGAAFNKEAMRRRMKTLKKMGVNSIRTSHNMPAPELMELADELGFYIDSEAFDMWEEPKTEYDYARFFDDWAEKDVASWIRRDRNHPSVIMWSIGNEIHDTHMPAGIGLTKRLMGDVLQHDPAKNARVTIGSNYMPWEGAQNCADIVKLAGYNYAEIHYDSHHEKYPDWVIYGSETSSVVQSRGVYHFPLSESILTEDDEQCSSLGNSRPSWAAKSVEYCIAVDRDRPFAMGQYLWTGHDYIGEPTPYKTKNSYFGQIDTAGFPKDAYYMYQAEWTDYRKAPMVHLFPYWDFNPGQMIDVRACTNAPKVEVFVNGVSQGVREIDHAHGTDLFPAFHVAYAPGEIRAVAYDESGTVIAEEVHRSFGDSAKLTATADKEWMRADGCDLIFVEIGAEDADGNPVENAMDYVEVSVTGAGRLVGLDNGDSTDYDSYKGTRRKLFNGKLLAIIAVGTEAGPIGVTVRDANAEEKLEPVNLVLQAVAAEVPEGVSTVEQNSELPLITGLHDAVPVRKIELRTEDGQHFDEEKTDILVKAYLYPENAADREILFAAVNDAGITSNLAEIEMLPVPAGDKAAAYCRIHAKGDGSFRVRATSKSGTEKVKIMSQLEFSADGLGEAYLDPYGFIAGALYTRHTGDVGGFSEKSVASAQEGVSEICYDGVDFGEYGSDEITLPIFAMSGEKHYLQIWEGMPGDDGSEMLADVVYQKPSTWDVYKPETYKLKRRIKGITSLCLVTHDQRYFIKGFSFTKPEKAYGKLSATEYSNLYGDTFTVKEDAIEGIGNNVSIEYENMDFGEKGLSGVTVCGRTALPSNTIHIRFFKEDGEAVNQIIEFPHSEEYTEKQFALESVKGSCKVGFIFLPGCDFDFKWFQFS